jgi:hypothetical protein
LRLLFALIGNIKSGRYSASIAVLAVFMLYSESSIAFGNGYIINACGGGYVINGTVVESGYGKIVSVDRKNGTVTLDHGATLYVLKEGQTRFPIASLDVLDDRVSVVGSWVRFEIRVSKGDIAIIHIERAQE